jgi:hypothetical protein
MRKAAMGHVCRGLASTQNEVIILDKQHWVQNSSKHNGILYLDLSVVSAQILRGASVAHEEGLESQT